MVWEPSLIITFFIYFHGCKFCTCCFICIFWVSSHHKVGIWITKRANPQKGFTTSRLIYCVVWKSKLSKYGTNTEVMWWKCEFPGYWGGAWHMSKSVTGPSSPTRSTQLGCQVTCTTFTCHTFNSILFNYWYTPPPAQRNLGVRLAHWCTIFLGHLGIEI